MKIEANMVNGFKVVKLIGEIRISTQNEFKDLLDKLVTENEGKYVIVNMSEVFYMNSAGLGIIIDTYKKFKESNGKIVFCNLMPDIMQLFEVTKLNRFIEIFNDESDAISKLTA